MHATLERDDSKSDCITGYTATPEALKAYMHKWSRLTASTFGVLTVLMATVHGTIACPG